MKVNQSGKASRDISCLWGNIDAAVSELLYYNRKEDEDLPVGKIEEMIDGGIVTVSDIVDRFGFELTRCLSRR